MPSITIRYPENDRTLECVEVEAAKCGITSEQMIRRCITEGLSEEVIEQVYGVQDVDKDTLNRHLKSLIEDSDTQAR